MTLQFGRGPCRGPDATQGGCEEQPGVHLRLKRGTRVLGPWLPPVSLGFGVWVQRLDHGCRRVSLPRAEELRTWSSVQLLLQSEQLGVSRVGLKLLDALLTLSSHQGPLRLLAGSSEIFFFLLN